MECHGSVSSSSVQLRRRASRMTAGEKT
jgi:hypothetical protein